MGIGDVVVADTSEGNPGVGVGTSLAHDVLDLACNANRGESMEHKTFKDVERFSKETHVHVPLFNNERIKV
jgi:hypothetical protein